MSEWLIRAVVCRKGKGATQFLILTSELKSAISYSTKVPNVNKPCVLLGNCAVEWCLPWFAAETGVSGRSIESLVLVLIFFIIESLWVNTKTNILITDQWCWSFGVCCSRACCCFTWVAFALRTRAPPLFLCNGVWTLMMCALACSRI